MEKREETGTANVVYMNECGAVSQPQNYKENEFDYGSFDENDGYDVEVYGLSTENSIIATADHNIDDGTNEEGVNDDGVNENMNLKKQNNARPEWYPLCVHRSEEENKQFMKNNNFSIQYIAKTKESKTRYMRCNLVKLKGPQCNARLVVRMSDREMTWVVETNGLDHTHEAINNKMRPEVCERIKNMREARIAPAKVLQLTKKEFGANAPSISQIYHLNQKEDNLSGKKFTTLGELS